MNIKQAIGLCTDVLSGKADNPAFEARCIAEAVLGLDGTGIIAHGSDKIVGSKADGMLELAKRRACGEPLQYVIGSWSFMGFELRVGRGVLIPRDDTEVVTRLCVDFLGGRSGKKALDLCSGSGAIAIALDKLCGADVTAVEKSGDALPYLSENIRLNNANVTVCRGDIFECYKDFEDGAFDLIVSNPPYIKSEDIPGLQPEVGYEPKTALDGGADGMDFYRAITRLWSGKLKLGGAIALELGEGQAEYVKTLMQSFGFADIETSRDLGGTQRAIIGVRKHKPNG